MKLRRSFGLEKAIPDREGWLAAGSAKCRASPGRESLLALFVAYGMITRAKKPAVIPMDERTR